MIGFAGPRVIKETIKRDLPEGFQTSEFVMEHGFLDMIVGRKELKERISVLLGLFAG
jgi:acetyl-CoA carboxylase carboxyl transferase subunit beta